MIVVTDHSLNAVCRRCDGVLLTLKYRYPKRYLDAILHALDKFQDHIMFGDPYVINDYVFDAKRVSRISQKQFYRSIYNLCQQCDNWSRDSFKHDDNLSYLVEFEFVRWCHMSKVKNIKLL